MQCATQTDTRTRAAVRVSVGHPNGPKRTAHRVRFGRPVGDALSSADVCTHFVVVWLVVPPFFTYIRHVSNYASTTNHVF
jgi:hypothetical protein